MDKNEVTSILRKANLSDSKTGTRIGYFDATMDFRSFQANQVNNRSSASWKTAQYIVVESRSQKDTMVILNGWKKLVGNYTDQWLIIIDPTNTVTVYSHDGILRGNDEFLISLLKIKNENKATGGKNEIFYGVPGCGKSYKIDTDYKPTEDNSERVVFHPDYTYSDFVGQVMPVVNGEKVSYEFVPGPFTRILSKAINDPSNVYYLIIEEINRGNASAIFGDVFQLLDRDKNGEGSYSVSNIEVAKIVFGKENGNRNIRIPSNLSLLATMNTSDQNVFTLDTAFTRRWQMKRVPNDFEKCAIANVTISETNVTWKEFAMTINNEILMKNKDNPGAEDNRLGAYFVSEEELKDKGLFAEKVIKYLWNDAFKYSKEEVFKSQYTDLDSVIEGFIKQGTDIFDIAFSKRNDMESDREN